MRFLMMSTAFLTAALGAAQAQVHADEKAIVVPANTESWVAGPAALPPGARVAVIEGDPAKPGAFTLRLALTDGYRIPPHFHSTPEDVTVRRANSWWVWATASMPRSSPGCPPARSG